MSATSQNNVWEKVELALKRFVVNNSAVGVNDSNVYCGHDNGIQRSPRIICECSSGVPESSGRKTGNWICTATIYIKTKLHDETGEDNSGRFASILDSLEDDDAPAVLSNNAEFITVFQHQITGFTKTIQGDTLVSEIGLTLTCCGSVIT